MRSTIWTHCTSCVASRAPSGTSRRCSIGSSPFYRIRTCRSSRLRLRHHWMRRRSRCPRQSAESAPPVPCAPPAPEILPHAPRVRKKVHP
eukprot:682932-Prymnesium_polylepis.1